MSDEPKYTHCGAAISHHDRCGVDGEQCRQCSLIDALRAENEIIRAQLRDAEAGELKNALAVGQAVLELSEERKENNTLRAQLSEARAAEKEMEKAIKDAFADLGRANRQLSEARARLALHGDAVAALLKAVDCGMVPTSSAREGGANAHVTQLHVADEIRDVLAKADAAPVSPAAQVAQGVADDVVRDYPEGWVFHSADFSMAASCPARSGRVTLVRDLAGRDWWLSLSDEDKERVPLYVYGSGNTLSDAIKDAALLAAAQQKKEG